MRVHTLGCGFVYVAYMGVSVDVFVCVRVRLHVCECVA